MGALVLLWWPCRAEHSSSSVCLHLLPALLDMHSACKPSSRRKKIYPNSSEVHDSAKMKNKVFFRCCWFGVTLITCDCNLGSWGAEGRERDNVQTAWNVLKFSEVEPAVSLWLLQRLVSMYLWSETYIAQLTHVFQIVNLHSLAVFPWCPPLAATSCSTGNGMSIFKNF